MNVSPESHADVWSFNDKILIVSKALHNNSPSAYEMIS